MDFYQIKEEHRKGTVDIYPDFVVGRSRDIMIRGKSFYAVWDEDAGLWSRDEYDVQRLIDKELHQYQVELSSKTDSNVRVKWMRDFSSNTWINFRKYLYNMSDNYKELDERLTFSNTEVKKTDYVSKRVPYPLEEGSIDSFEELISTLYDPEERDKLEWAIGSIVAGDSRELQKFIVLYGESGSGKSTIIKVIEQLFEGYYATFDAKALTSSSNAFSTEAFRDNPLVAIQHDGDLSRIEDNTKLNSITSHEVMTINEKYKPSYSSTIDSFLIVGTNKPVKITDAKSGIIRRLIDVRPSGRKIHHKRYFNLMNQIRFELGAIAHHCLEKYRDMGKNYYNNYIPMSMIMETDIFFNFVEDSYFVFREQDGVSLTQAYQMYKEFCDETLLEFKMPRHKFRDELRSYFEEFTERTRINGSQVRNYYSGFKHEKFSLEQEPVVDDILPSVTVDKTVSLFDELRQHCHAQYAGPNDIPKFKWDNVSTTLKDLDTKQVHYVKLPENHIVIDFDIRGEDGSKSLDKNLEAASKWPPTYTELSKSGKGVHLHYIYDGDTSRLSRVYDDDIEVKVFTGNSSLRRRLTLCNDIPLATINSGLPLKGEKMIDFDVVKSEKGLRSLIKRNLNKEIHPATKPSIDFIFKILSDAHKSGLKYDVTDMRPAVLLFATNSTNQANYCVKLVNEMKFSSHEEEWLTQINEPTRQYSSEDIYFYDVEVFPNLLLLGYKKMGDPNKTYIFQPTPEQIEPILQLRLVGHNVRRYDNHILYARYIGYSIEQIYNLSRRIINDKSRSAFFREAYNISYGDTYDFSRDKKGLKKWEIDLGLKHHELGLKWDEPVPEELWPKVAEYNGDDLDASEAVFKHLEADWKARLILSELSGLSPNHTDQQHAAKIMFGDDRRPQQKFVYTDLSKDFPGYVFNMGKSTYKGHETGEGGFVWAKHGMYSNVALLDVESMHPTSAIVLNAFGPYTKNLEEILKARLDIKHGELDKAKKALGGILTKFLDGDTKGLSNALKIFLNIIYGLSSASFDNKFRDPRNKDNIIAKRGALFMVDLLEALQEKGIEVCHIKTDSVKLPNATEKDIQFVKDFGKKYGYKFEHETTYEKMCLVNDSVFVAKDKDGWVAVGKQFQVPYVFKTMFSKEPLVERDYMESFQVSTALYLDMNENLKEDEHDYRFVGRIGAFTPVKTGQGGGILLREKKDGGYSFAQKSKGYRWLEYQSIEGSTDISEIVDLDYYNKMVDEAYSALSKFGDVGQFLD